MRLFRLYSLTFLLFATLLRTARGRPVHENTTLAEAENYQYVEKRQPGNLAVPLVLTALETWQGSRPYTGMFGTGATIQEVRASAQQTYESLQGRLPATLFVSVIFVPGAGLAAGTIWRASDQAFETSAAVQAPGFWAAVPGPNQQRRLGAKNEAKWHAEAVAARMAETAFQNFMVGGVWPAGTKIATYGKVWGEAGGPKPACSPGHSSVMIPCSEWLPRLGIQMG